MNGDPQHPIGYVDDWLEKLQEHGATIEGVDEQARIVLLDGLVELVARIVKDVRQDALEEIERQGRP